MKLYKVHYETNGGASAGVSWHTSRKNAIIHANKYKAESEPDENLPSIAQLTIVLTRGGILDFLDRHASHPDNG